MQLSHEITASSSRWPSAPRRGPVAGPDLRRRHQDRGPQRPVEPLRRPRRPGLGGGRPHGGRGLRRRQPRASRSRSSSADHQNKPDVGSQIARQWYDVDKVDVIVDVPTSSVALAVNQITRDKGKAFIVSSAATLGPHRQGVLAEHRALDLRHLGARQRHRQRDRQDRRRHLVLPHRRLRLRPRARARRRGGGAQERRQGARQGAPPAQRPQDFSSFLLQAQASKAKIIGLANAGGDTTNSIKQARRVRHRARAARTSPACSCSSPTCTRSGLEQGAGADPHRDVLLGPERRRPARVAKRFAERQQRQSSRPWSTPASTRACCTT